MTARPILKDPHLILQRVADPITPAELRGDAMQQLIDDMFDTVAANTLIGMAASQIGVSRRLFVVDFSDESGRHGPFALANPILSHLDGEIVWTEASPCRPGQSVQVTRHAKLRCRGLARNGKPMTIKAGGLLAVCIQHQIDHLNGMLCFDRVAQMWSSTPTWE